MTDLCPSSPLTSLLFPGSILHCNTAQYVTCFLLGSREKSELRGHIPSTACPCLPSAPESPARLPELRCQQCHHSTDLFPQGPVLQGSRAGAQGSPQGLHPPATLPVLLGPWRTRRLCQPASSPVLSEAMRGVLRQTQLVGMPKRIVSPCDMLESGST